MTIPNVVGNIAGGAQAQRFAVANFERENAAAKARAAKQLQDSILTGLLNTGIQTAVGFGEKAYDEAHSGARAQQQIDDAKAVDQFNMRVKRLDALVNAPSFDDAMKVKQDAIGSTGYGMEQETAADRSPMVSAARELAKARDSAPETGYGRMGRMGIDGGPSAAEGSPVSREARPSPSPVNLGSGQRDMGAPSQPVLVQRTRTDDEALAAMPEGDDRAFQTRLIEAKRQAAAAATAAAEKAKQERRDALRKQLIDAQLKSDQNMGDLQQKTEQKLGPKGRPTNVPQFGIQPVIDPKTGIVRPKFVEQPRVQVPVSGGGGGVAKPAFSGVLAEPVVLISAREGRKGDPTTGTPTKTWAARGEWATKAIQAPAKYALGPAEAGQVAAALRIIKANEADPTKADVVAKAVKVLDGARDASIQRMGPVFAQTGDVMGTSPTDIAKADKAEQTAAEKAAQATADRQAAIDAQLESIKADAIKLEDDYAKNIASILDKTFKRRGSKGGLTMQQLRDAADGDAPPDGLDADGLAAWQSAASAAEAARTYREQMIQSLRNKAAVVSGRKQVTPGGQ